MDGLHNQVFAPLTLQELFDFWQRFPDATPYAGGTELVRGQGGRTFVLPGNILALFRLEELRRISRTERYLEIGAAVTLDELLGLGKIVPEILKLAVMDIATPQIRNLATIGGNLCCTGRRMDSFAAMVVLDAKFELRTASASRWIAAGRFAPGSGAPVLEKKELLTRIRIPLETWHHVSYCRIGQTRWPDAVGAVFSFIARAEKGILSEARLALAGKELVRDREIENSIVGKNLPMHRREVAVFLDRWRTRMQDDIYPDGLLGDRFLNLIEQAVLNLAD
jgi:CO/xanthine dehydrogenase FAD-binding subunit